MNTTLMAKRIKSTFIKKIKTPTRKVSKKLESQLKNTTQKSIAAKQANRLTVLEKRIKHH
jgi:polyhydroxyalkanoate synthesis regulator phasin